MPHGGGGRGESGIEGLTSPTGLFTALAALGMFGAAVWVFAKHPVIFKRAILAAIIGGLLFFQHGTVLDHPWAGLLMLFVGVCLAGNTNTT